MRQHDVEPDRFGPGVARALVRGFHDRRTAARADHELALAVLDDRLFRGQLGQLVGLAVVLRLFGEVLDHAPLGLRQLRRPLHRLGHRLGRRDAGGAVHDQGRPHPGLVEQHLGLQQLELEAHWPEFVAQQEVRIAERQAIGRMARLRRVGRGPVGESGFLVGGVELAIGEIAFTLLRFFVCHCQRPRPTAPGGQARCALRDAVSRPPW